MEKIEKTLFYPGISQAFFFFNFAYPIRFINVNQIGLKLPSQKLLRPIYEIKHNFRPKRCQ